MINAHSTASARTRRRRHRSPRQGVRCVAAVLVFVLAGALVAAAPATALAAPTSASKPTVASGGDTTLTGTSTGAGQSSGALPSSVPSLICLTCEPDPGPGIPSGCYSISISKQMERGDNPEFGGVYSRISWTGRVTCQLTSGGTE